MLHHIMFKPEFTRIIYTEYEKIKGMDATEIKRYPVREWARVTSINLDSIEAKVQQSKYYKLAVVLNSLSGLYFSRKPFDEDPYFQYRYRNCSLCAWGSPLLRILKIVYDIAREDEMNDIELEAGTIRLSVVGNYEEILRHYVDRYQYRCMYAYSRNARALLSAIAAAVFKEIGRKIKELDRCVDMSGKKEICYLKIVKPVMRLWPEDLQVIRDAELFAGIKINLERIPPSDFKHFF